MDKVKEECGVFGIIENTGKNVAKDIYYGLLALQHRGQESAGMAICDTTGKKGNMCVQKQMGLVSEVFDEDTLSAMNGNIGIGHVRYSTTGLSSLPNAQPIAFQYIKGTLALVHNGNIVNALDIKEKLLQEGSVFNATSDSEVVATLLARQRACCSSIEEAVARTVPSLKGGYAIIVMSPRKLVAARDPFGIKPLCLGRRNNGYVIASESCGLDAVNAQFVRDIRPGEIVSVKGNELSSFTPEAFLNTPKAHCIFEYIYFARLDSTLDGVSVYSSRIKAGRILAGYSPVNADIVTGVPESGITAALGYSMESGIPFTNVFCKNTYVGRTFIKPSRSERENAVRVKLGVIAEAVKDKDIILIDDSIVRGTTIARLIRMLKENGARKVHVRICSPPFLYPCYYGTDVPDNKDLIANRFSEEEIRKRIDADSLCYMRIEDLWKLTGDAGICKACFDGIYPDSKRE